MIKNDLELFTERFADKPVTWGVDDCTMTPLQWVQEQRNVKLPTIAYNSKSEAVRLIAKNGSLENIWSNSLAGVLRRNHGVPEFGDVGLIHTDTAGIVGGIFAYEGAFLWRGDGGFVILAPRSEFIHAVWTVFE